MTTTKEYQYCINVLNHAKSNHMFIKIENSEFVLYPNPIPLTTTSHEPRTSSPTLEGIEQYLRGYEDSQADVARQSQP